MSGPIVRRPEMHELAAIEALVQKVVDETYGGLWALPPLPIGESDWSLAWIAVVDDELAGVVLTSGAWIDDLWVLAEFRGQGVGVMLLQQGEAKIAGCGEKTLRLRVVKSNVRAISFYKRYDWHVAREFPHEILPVMMVEMSKTI